jgi:hypothetical protein
MNWLALCEESIIISLEGKVLRHNGVSHYIYLDNPSGRTRPWGLLSL